MRIRHHLIAGVMSAVLAAATLSGCSAATSAAPTASTASTAAAAGGSAAEVMAANKTDHADATDSTANEAEVKEINLDGSTQTITAAGTYRLKGTVSNGQVIVNAPDAAVKLILAGVDITNPSGAAIAVTAAEEVTVILADGTQNTLRDSTSYAEGAEVNAALFSAADLTITGGGALNVYGNGNDAIASTDGLVIQSGTITVNAADDGIRGKDYLVIEGGTISVTGKGDGLKSDNAEDADAGYIAVVGGTVKVVSADDGADAATDIVTTGGSLDIKSEGKGLKSGVVTVLEGGTATVDAAGDGVHTDGKLLLTGADVTVTRSTEGLEGKEIVMAAGTVKVTSSDDGVNAAGGQGTGQGGEAVGDYSVTISGGTLTIDSGGDGFDSNGTASITGGTLVVNGPTQNGNGALDVNGSFQISGGVLVAAGSAGMAVAPQAESPQGWLSATLTSSVAAGSTLHIMDSSGATVATFVTTKAVQNIVYSSADIKSGEQYRVDSGGSAIATVTAGEAPASRSGGGRR